MPADRATRTSVCQSVFIDTDCFGFRQRYKKEADAPQRGVIPFLVIILYLCPHPKLSRYGTALEESLKASNRSVLPALRAGSGCSDSQEMAGAVGAAARGAIEADERGGRRSAWA